MPTALITGASSGIGATYAQRFAKRGHDLVIVSNEAERLEKAAEELRSAHGVKVEVIAADLTDRIEFDRVYDRLRNGTPIDILVNNAGMALIGPFVGGDREKTEKLLRLNILAVTMLAAAAVDPMVERGSGAIINISSALALLPEYTRGVYPASKSYVLAFSQTLSAEVLPQGVYVQAVLPTVARTEIYSRAGADIANYNAIMEVDAFVDAALMGFDRRELVTIPAVEEHSKWEAYEAARLTLAGEFTNTEPGSRYKAS